MKNFLVTSQFRGYENKTDETKLRSGTLIEGSQNVLVIDGESVRARMGYELDGAASAVLEPIVSSHTWINHQGIELPLRSYDDELEVRTEVTGTAQWVRLADGWSAVDFVFSTWWDDTEKIDLLLFVNGDANIYEWSGGVAAVASVTSNTITKSGTETWAELGFYTTRNKTIIIDGTEYAYTGGETTTTLTGVTPDPSSNGVAADDIAVQKVVTNSNKPASGVQNDIISTLNNQVYVAGNESRLVYVSTNDDFTDFTPEATRIPGDAAVLTLDSTPKAFVPQEDTMYVAAGSKDWYKITFQLSADLKAEAAEVKKLKTGEGEAARSQDAVTNIKNNVAFISQEPTLDELGRLEDIDTPRSRPLSDPIKDLLDSLDLTNVHVKYWRNAIYIAVPNEGMVLIYDLQNGYWQPPQLIPVSRLEVIGGLLYGHSNAVPETYKLFTGFSDNELPISAKAVFSYQNFGKRGWQKRFNEFYSEGYITPGNVLQLEVDYEYQGGSGVREFDINGTDNGILFQDTGADTSLGVNPLGEQPLGMSGELNSTETNLAKFRVIHVMPELPLYEMSATYSSYGTGLNWELLAFGPNAKLAQSDNLSIKRSAGD